MFLRQVVTRTLLLLPSACCILVPLVLLFVSCAPASGSCLPKHLLLPMISHEPFSHFTTAAFSHVTSDNIISTTTPTSSPTPDDASPTPETGIWIEKHLTNVTKESGENVIMKCEFGSAIPLTISWFRNEAPLEIVKGKFEVRHSAHAIKGKMQSRLKIHQVDVHDMGFYKCVGSNGVHSAETTGVLRVEGGSYMSSQSIPDFNPIIPEFPGLFPER